MKRRTVFLSPQFLLLIAILVFAAQSSQVVNLAAASAPTALLPSDIKARLYIPVAAAPKLPVYTPPNWSGPNTGSVVCLAGDPHNQNIIYAGSWGGGVFRSTDQGSNWTWVSQGLRNFQIDSLAVDPTDSRILYAGTHGGGLYKSDDRGDSWDFYGLGIQENAAIYSIAVHPGNNQVVFAATRKMGNGLNTPYYGVLYKSVNGGENWYPVLDEVGGPAIRDWIYSIAIKPSDPSLILVATHEHGPYISTHGGEKSDWAPVPVDGLSEYTKGRSVAFDPRSGSASAFFATWHGGFYKSTNSGASFKLTDSSISSMKIYPNSISPALQNPEIMYMATMDTASGVLKSTNNGGAWTSIGLRTDNIYTTLSPDDGNVVFAGTVGDGLYKSLNGGRSWFHATSGMVITQVTSLVPSSSGGLYLSARGKGVFRSLDGGQTWTDFNSGLSDLNISALAEVRGEIPVLLALTATGEVWRTAAGAEANWSLSEAPAAALQVKPETGAASLWVPEPAAELQALDAGDINLLSAPDLTGQILALDAETASPFILLASPGSGLFASADGGASFTPYGPGSLSVTALALDSTRTTRLAAASGSQVFVSEDSGLTWTALPETGQTVYSLAYSSNPGAAGLLLAGTPAGVLAWDGQSWRSFGLEGQAVYTLAADPWQPGRVWAGTQGSTFQLTRSGGAPDWAPIPELAGSTTSVIRFDPNIWGRVYFGTTGRGVLTIDLTQMP